MAYTKKRHKLRSRRVNYARRKTVKRIDGGNKSHQIKCGPKDKFQKNTFSCYANKTLEFMRRMWNARHPHEDTFIPAGNTKIIHMALTYFMKNICNKESCWLKQAFMQNKRVGGKNNIGSRIANESFAPTAPTKWKTHPNEWLSNIDIIAVMKQYERAYKCFEFIGPSPIDFDKKIDGECVWDEVCNFSISDQLTRGKTKIGIVFNTDPHTKSGQHWISIFINLKRGTFFYFDSTGEAPPAEIVAFSKRVITQAQKQLNLQNIKFDTNTGFVHQHGNTECGMYSLYFIIFMLEDKLTSEYVKTHRLSDKHMEKYRSIFFNINKPI